MYSVGTYRERTSEADAKRQSVLVELCIRCRKPLEANLTKDEAILLLTAVVRGDFSNVVSRNLEKHALLSSIARAT